MRLWVQLQNESRRLRGNAFRTFVHPVLQMDQLLKKAGFARVEVCDGLVWGVATYARQVNGHQSSPGATAAQAPASSLS